MSAVTPVITTMAGSLVTEILLIVAGLAALVGISILVAYGFKKLRSVGSK
jgi:hypothetical protein